MTYKYPVSEYLRYQLALVNIALIAVPVEKSYMYQMNMMHKVHDEKTICDYIFIAFISL